MKTSKRSLLIGCIAAILAIAVIPNSQGATVKASGDSGAAATRWSIQVEQVNPAPWTYPLPFKSRSTRMSWTN